MKISMIKIYGGDDLDHIATITPGCYSRPADPPGTITGGSECWGWFCVVCNDRRRAAGLTMFEVGAL